MALVSEETKRLSRLVRSMLDISRLPQEGGVPEERKSQFDVAECAGRVLITFEQKILAKELDVHVNFPEHPVYTRADQDSIIQVIYNLLDNAVKFCQVGGRLGVEIRQTPEKIYVAISNTGNPIPVEELPFVFERFHKTDKSRTDKDGWGLGLYIVKTIVCSHGENIRVSSAGDTTEFTFTLPCA
jgi:signal transduction histidine kinase